LHSRNSVTPGGSLFFLPLINLRVEGKKPSYLSFTPVCCVSILNFFFVGGTFFFFFFRGVFCRGGLLYKAHSKQFSTKGYFLCSLFLFFFGVGGSFDLAFSPGLAVAPLHFTFFLKPPPPPQTFPCLGLGSPFPHVLSTAFPSFDRKSLCRASLLVSFDKSHPSFLQRVEFFRPPSPFPPFSVTKPSWEFHLPLLQVNKTPKPFVADAGFVGTVELVRQPPPMRLPSFLSGGPLSQLNPPGRTFAYHGFAALFFFYPRHKNTVFDPANPFPPFSWCFSLPHKRFFFLGVGVPFRRPPSSQRLPAERFPGLTFPLTLHCEFFVGLFVFSLPSTPLPVGTGGRGLFWFFPPVLAWNPRPRFPGHHLVDLAFPFLIFVVCFFIFLVCFFGISCFARFLYKTTTYFFTQVMFWGQVIPPPRLLFSCSFSPQWWC